MPIFKALGYPSDVLSNNEVNFRDNHSFNYVTVSGLGELTVYTDNLAPDNYIDILKIVAMNLQPLVSVPGSISLLDSETGDTENAKDEIFFGPFSSDEAITQFRYDRNLSLAMDLLKEFVGNEGIQHLMATTNNLRKNVNQRPTSYARFFKTIFQVEVLSQDSPLASENLFDIAQAISTGDCSGVVTEVACIGMTAAEAAVALVDQGSEPGFFGIIASLAQNEAHTIATESDSKPAALIALQKAFPSIEFVLSEGSAFNDEEGDFISVTRDGTSITNPFVSSCGRVESDPVKDYGIPIEAAKLMVDYNQAKVDANADSAKL
jgi:hypothetical protein